MGLDMYLYKHTYVRNWDFQKPEEQHEITIKKGGVTRTDIKPERISYIVEQVGYWRKFNALHKWIIDNCNGGEDVCREMYVDGTKIEELKNILRRILDDKKLAKELLPTEEGFFFGSQEYDDYYFEKVQYTLELLEEETADGQIGDYYYYPSW